MARYEFSEGSSNKFWEIALKGKAFTTTYGRIGSAGQSTTKTFGSPAQAEKEYEKLIAEKTAKGYRPPGKGGKASARDEENEEAAPARGGGRGARAGRYFEFSEGSSNKFWEITVDGKSVVTRYGRIGTDGQKTSKKFNTPNLALEKAEEQIAEKVRKGYVEEGGQKGGQADGRYFEFWDGSSHKFWEIAVDGKSVVTRYGRFGTDGQKIAKKWNTPNLALDKAEEQIAEKVREGYVEKGGAGAGGEEDAPAGGSAGAAVARNPELEKAIFADPDDEEAYLVYADWLQGQGDPRGELIMLSAQAAKTKDRELKKAAAKLFAKHKAHFLGPLAEYRKTLDGNDTEAMTWRWGFVESLRIGFDRFSNEELEDDLDERLDKMLATLLSHPSCRFLTEVVVGLYREDDDHDYQRVVDALTERPPPALRSLVVNDNSELDISSANLGDYGKLWRKLPGLRKLMLTGRFTLGTVDLPELRHAEFHTGGLSRSSIKSIANARWPKLERLEVWFGSSNYGAEGKINDIKPLLEGKGLPALRHLGLMNCEFADDIARVIGKSKILPQLEFLDLSMGTMSDAGVDALLSSKAAFAKLKGFNLDSNCISDAGIRRLKGLCRGLATGSQRDEEDPEERYVDVGE